MEVAAARSAALDPLPDEGQQLVDLVAQPRRCAGGSRQRRRRQVVRPMPPASEVGGTGRARLPGPAAAGHRAGEGLQFPPPRSASHTH